MSRVVVVGGGFGGTAAAARLAKQGHQVTLVERLDRLGGAVGFVERDGYRWDAGPTSTALPAVVRDLFRKSGRPLERELDLVPVEPMREHRFEDGTVLAMPSGNRSAQLEAVDAALGAGLGQQWVDHVHSFAETWDVLRRVYLERPWSPDHVDKASTALLRTRDHAAEGGHPDVEGRAAARGRAAAEPARRARPAQRPCLDGHVGLRRAELRRLDRPRRDGPAGRGDDQAARRAQGRGAARDERRGPAHPRGPRRRRGHRPRLAGRRRGRLRDRPARAAGAGAARLPHDARDPAGAVPPRPVRRPARPAARGGAARRPDAGRAHERRPPPPAARPGPCWAADGSPRT